MEFWIWVLALLLPALLLYWELILAEGTHLGPRVVIWLYELVAARYERIKKFDVLVEADLLGLPLTEALAPVEAPRVLDVAAGTGRLARALLRQIAFDGTIVCLEPAARMLAHGRSSLAGWPGRAAWVRALAWPLPFPDETFDAVTCLEALEFLPDPPAALRECVRVLRPGGLLVVTNRVGWDAPLLLGKHLSRTAFLQRLESLALQAPMIHPWVTDYDLAWARKGKG